MKLINHKDVLDAKELFSDRKSLNEIDDVEVISKSFDRAHYSASFIKSWLECPAKLIINTITKDKTSAPLLIGSEVHRLLEEYYSKQLSKEQLYKLWRDSKEIDVFYKDKVKDYLDAYFKIKPYRDNMNNLVHFTEKEIITEVDPLGVALPVKIKGFIDRIDIADEGIYIIDYKTSSRKPSPDQYKDQMTIYKWIVEKELSTPVDGVYIASLYTKEPKYIKQSFSLKDQSVLIDKIFDVDKEVNESIKERLFIKREGLHCKFCPLQKDGKCKIACTLKFE